jgi:hypothetical protein
MEAGMDTITQVDADGLAEKLKMFVETLTPGEKDALKMALAPSGVPEGDDTSGFGGAYAVDSPFGLLRVDAQSYYKTPWGSEQLARFR